MGPHSSTAGLREEPVLGSSAGARRTWSWTWLSILSYIGLGYVGAGWDLLVNQSPGPRSLALAVVSIGSAALSVSYIRHAVVGLGRHATTTRQRLSLVAATTMPWILASIESPGSLVWAMIPWAAASLVAVDMSPRIRIRWLAAVLGTLCLVRIVAGLITGATWASIMHEGETPVTPLLFLSLLVLLPASMVFQVWLWDVVVRLRESQDAVAELARARERLRFAADLHDVQGHYLQVIALKTELAERLVDVDPGLAKTHVIEAQDLARRALRETRALVRGYRTIDLSTEAANAASVLEAAGIDCTMSIALADATGNETPGAVDSDQLLGSLLREATTNIIRHSSARRVGIAVHHHRGSLTMTVENDGVGAEPTDPDGTGLVSLGERFARAGGRLTHRSSAGTFVLEGSLPAGAVTR